MIDSRSARGGQGGRRARTPRGVATTALLLFSLGGCREHKPSREKGTPSSVARYPHAADRFTTLVRRQLSARDPVRAEQEVLCETDRMARALGEREALLRVQTALDTVYRTRADSNAVPGLDRQLGGRVFTAGGAACDSMIAAWDSVAPIRVDTTPSR